MVFKKKKKVKICIMLPVYTCVSLVLCKIFLSHILYSTVLKNFD